MKMFTIMKWFRFESAHRLRLHKGACQNIHGHSYKLEVELALENGTLQQVGPETDMVSDFGTIKKAIVGIINDGVFKGKMTVPFDHSIMLHKRDPLFKVLTEQNLYLRIIGMTSEPTAEHMASLFAGMFQEQLDYDKTPVQVICVRVWETENNMAEYRVPAE